MTVMIQSVFLHNRLESHGLKYVYAKTSNQSLTTVHDICSKSARKVKTDLYTLEWCASKQNRKRVERR